MLVRNQSSVGFGDADLAQHASQTIHADGVVIDERGADEERVAPAEIKVLCLMAALEICPLLEGQYFGG